MKGNCMLNKNEYNFLKKIVTIPNHLKSEYSERIINNNIWIEDIKQQNNIEEIINELVLKGFVNRVKTIISITAIGYQEYIKNRNSY
jgi:hypothetical protein